MRKITYNKQYIDKSDINIVSKVIKNDLITGGSYVKIFEKKLCNFLKVKFATACINGTAGLDIAFKSINLSKKDIIIMPVVNFIASYSMANNLGAKIYLADVDPITGQMTPKTLLNCIKKNKLKKIKAVVTMYLGGYPENIDGFFKMKKKYRFFIIEDACHAFGSKYEINKKKYMVGSCTHADISVFSFHPVKTITTAEGGLLTTNSKKIDDHAKKIRNHNILRGKNYWDYDIKRTSLNYRLSDINCALGISQLKKINLFLKNRKKSYIYYKNKFEKLGRDISLPSYKSFKNASYHLFLINIDFENIKSNKDKLFKYLNKKNIFPQFHYKPLNMFSFYKKNNENFLGAIRYYKNTLSIPLFYQIKKSEQNYIIQHLRYFLNKIKK